MGAFLTIYAHGIVRGRRKTTKPPSEVLNDTECLFISKTIGPEFEVLVRGANTNKHGSLNIVFFFKAEWKNSSQNQEPERALEKQKIHTKN